MNFSWVFLVGLCLSGAASVKIGPVESSSELFGILDEFLALVPDDKLGEIFITYLYSDKEFQALLEYFKTDGFKGLVQKLNSIDDVLNIYDYVESAGLDVYALLNNLHDTIGLPHLTPRRHGRSTSITGGVAGFIADFQAILPIPEIKALHQKKLETSPAFAKFVKDLKSPRFQELINAVLANKEFQKILKTANEVGIDVIGIVQFYGALLGIKFPESNLHGEKLQSHVNVSKKVVKRSAIDDLDDDLREFVDLVPRKKWLKFLENHLVNDEGFNAAIEFFFTEEFKDLVQKLESFDDLRNLFDYLKEAGLDVYAVVNEFHVILGIPPLKPRRHSRSVEITSGADGFIADYKKILPIDQIAALHEKKLETSPAFARLVDYWQSPRFLELIDALRANEEFQRLLSTVNEGGIDTKAIVDLYATMLGLEIPRSSYESLSRGGSSVVSVL